MSYGNYSTPGASSSHNSNPSAPSLTTQGINPLRQRRAYTHQEVTEDGITYNRAMTPANETEEDKATRKNANSVAKSRAKKRAGGQMQQMRQRRAYTHQEVTEDGITYNRAMTPANETEEDKATRKNANRSAKSRAKKRAGGQMQQMRTRRHHPYEKSHSRASGSQAGTSSMGDAPLSYQSSSFSASMLDRDSFGVPSQLSGPFFSQSASFGQGPQGTFPPYGHATGTSSLAALSFYPTIPEPPLPDYSQTDGIRQAPQQYEADSTSHASMQLLQLQQQAKYDEPMNHLPHLSLAVRTSLEELQSTLNSNSIWLVNDETNNHFGNGTAFAAMSPNEQVARIQAYSNTFNTMAGTEPFSSDLNNTVNGLYDVFQVLHYYTFQTTDTSKTQSKQ